MAEFQIDGRMRVDSLQKQFKEAFGGTLRVYYHHHFADATARLAEIRGKGAPATGELAVKGSMKVSTFEEKMMEQFGIEVQVADAANEVLINNNALLSACADAKAKAGYQREEYTREYWVERACEANVAIADQLLGIIQSFVPEYQLKYNKIYIGLQKDGTPKNFMGFTPQKKELAIRIEVTPTPAFDAILTEKFGEFKKDDKGYSLKVNTDDTEKKGGFFKRLFGKLSSNIDALKPILQQAEKESRK